MKKEINSVGLMWIGILCSALAILMMFVPSISLINGKIYNSSQIFFDSVGKDINGAWPTFVGYMMIVVSLIPVVVIAVPSVNISINVEKIILIGASVVMVVGSVIIMLNQLWFSLINDMIDSFTKLNTLPGPYLTLLFSLLSSGLYIFALKKDL